MAIDLREMGRKARRASRLLATASTEQKNAALLYMAEALAEHEEFILAANRQDIETASPYLRESLLERLSLQGRLQGIASDLRHVAALPDPIGECFDARTVPSGLKLYRKRTPLGVIGVIYESRPNVTVDVAALCIKSGNCCILRGGKEALQTNMALGRVAQSALSSADLPEEAVQLIPSPDREQLHEMLRLSESIDLIIPRGGAALHQLCREESRIPVITGGMGICHLFVDASARKEEALRVILNAKIDRPAACNALDTVLVHADIATTFLPPLAEALEKAGVSYIVDARAQEVLPQGLLAGPSDFDQEWLALELGIKVVGGLDEAIAHIADHSAGHSDGILTETKEHAERFVRFVDSSAVFVNASTRFNDGGQFGLGAEVAISTQKVQARGPMGLRELTSYKWVAEGNYSVR